MPFCMYIPSILSAQHSGQPLSETARARRLQPFWRRVAAVAMVLLVTLLHPTSAQAALSGFDPGADAAVHIVAVQPDGKLLLGGDFTEVAGQTRNRLARLNVDGTLDAAFDPNPSNSFGTRVSAIAVQTDGKILVGGDFTNIGGLPIARIARLNADGTVDPTFNATPDHAVTQLIVQPDGKILAGGAFTNVGGQLHQKIVRLHADGTVDGSFNAQVGGAFAPWGIALQADGKVLVVGLFTTVNGQPRSNVVRLHPDGSVDEDFDPGANQRVSSVVVQPDGKIVLGGDFTWIAGRWHNRLARFNQDGTFDDSFVPGPNNGVNALALQPDGKIVVGGSFGTMAGQTSNRLARLNADGTLDASFGNPGANDVPLSVAVQTDGQIVLGGDFTEVAGQTRNRLARLNVDGTLDAAFDSGANGAVQTVVVQADGKVLVGGDFTTLGGQPRNRLGRVGGADAAWQTLEVATGGDGLRWLRSGAGPEVTQVRFATAAAPDAPAAGWTDLGAGTRVADGWAIDGLSMPRRTTIWVRAQGLAPAGGAGASSSLIGSLRELHLPDVPGAPTGLSAVPGNGLVHLTWTAAQANGSAITLYTVVGVPLSGGANVGCTTAAANATGTCSVAGLINGTTYSFTVTATNAVGAGSASASTSATPQAAAPGAPTGLTAVAGNSAVALSWTAPASNGGSPVTGYTVTGSPAGSCSTTGALTCTVSGLTNGVAHTFTVTATNTAGTSSASASASATPQVWTQSGVALPGGGSAAVQVGAPPGCTISGAQIDASAPAGAPAGASFPLGVFSFSATGAGCASATLSVRIDYPAGALSGLTPYKYGPASAGATPAWFPHGAVAGDSVTFSVTDNGVGDNDTQLGSIADPFAPVLLAAGPGAVSIPTLSEWGLIALSLLAALMGMGNLRRRGMV